MEGERASPDEQPGPEPAAADDSPEGARPSVRLERVTKRFGDLTAVRSLDLDVERGEFFTLLGPSGCGKTTTLRMVAGFEEPNEGRILLEGVDVAGLPPFRRPTNTVFQSYALFPHLSVEDNVAFGLRRKRVNRGEVKSRVREELERVGLAREAGRKPRQLSGGQQQRVALARALINRPAVLLLDEPLGALDLKLRKGLQLELKGIQRDVGITFLYVTHDQEEALTMSDRIAVMNEGIVEQLGAPEDVYERPRTRFVAGFIGVSNLMPAHVESVSGDEVAVRLEDGPTVRVSVRGRDLRPGERCYAVVRPEKLRISKTEEAPLDDHVSVEGVVESAVYLGTATQMIVSVRGDVRLTVLVPNEDDAQRQRLPGAGASVRLAWAPANMHLVSEDAPRAAQESDTGPEEMRTVATIV